MSSMSSVHVLIKLLLNAISECEGEGAYWNWGADGGNFVLKSTHEQNPASYSR